MAVHIGSPKQGQWGEIEQENIMSFFRDRLKLIRASISRQS